MPKGRPLLDLSRGKTCPHCQQTKPLTEFHKSKATVHGYQVYCKTCQNKRHTEWRMQNLEHVAAKQKRWRKNNPRRSKDHHLKGVYGLELGTYDAMLTEQGGKCAICVTAENSSRGDLHVDHCHDSGKVRGLLCHHCNLGIGHFQHDTALLEAAITYLTRTSR